MYWYVLADGHHKLIRWRFVTHAAIDGYSRMVVFVKCSTNNRASTVYELFLVSIHQYGLPSRIRCDQGRENQLIAQHMIHHRGMNRGSALVGSSVHNQRIERFWRDMHRCVIQTFYRLFYFLEYQDMLDPVNKFHLFALQYVFLPRINSALQQFAQGWNHHGIRTEHGLSPNQLFTRDMLQLRESNYTALDFFDRVDDNYGLDEEDATQQNTDNDDDDQEGVTIARSSVQLSYDQLQLLQQEVNPLSNDTNFGIDLYQQVLQFLHNILN